MSGPPFTEDSLVEISKRYGSKTITVARLSELTFALSDKPRDFSRLIDEEIAKEVAA